MAKLRRFRDSPYYHAVGRDLTGRRWCVSTKQTSRDAAARAARRIELERAIPQRRPLPLAAALATLVAHKQRKQVSAAELEIVELKGAHLLAHFGPQYDCQRMHLTDVNGYVDARRRSGISDSTIGKELGKLHEALILEKQAGRYQGEPTALRTNVLKPAEPCERWLDTDQFLDVLEELPERRRGHFLVYCHTGVRWSELYRIEARHLDYEHRRVWVIGHKGKREHRERWVPLSEDAFDVLAARAECHTAGPLFPDVWSKHNLRTTCTRAARRLGLGPLSTNDLRRTFCTWCATRGVSERECQRFMGHSPTSMLVRRVYAQLAPESGRAAVDTFPGASGLSQALSQTGAKISARAGLGRTVEPAVSAKMLGDPNEIRTRVTGVRGRGTKKNIRNNNRLRDAS